MKGKNILVTGGAGFIGYRLVLALSKNSNTEIWVLDNLHPQVHGENAIPPSFPDNVHFIKGNICDREKLEQVIKTSLPEVIFHLASETGTGQSMDKVACYCDVNVMGTAILLESIRKYSQNTQKLILSSSRAVYGEGLYRDEHGIDIVPDSRCLDDMRKGNYDLTDNKGNCLRPYPSSETVRPSPVSIYASTKLMQEQLVSQIGIIQPWDAIILRLQNVYGAGQSMNNPYTGVLSIFSQQLLSGQTLNIYEDGNIIRDFIYVDDVVSALTAAAGSSLPHGSILNIGTGCPSSILNVAKKLMGQYGLPTDLYEITGDFRAGDIRHALANIDKALSELNWQPSIEIDEGLSMLADWCKQELIIV